MTPREKLLKARLLLCDVLQVTPIYLELNKQLNELIGELEDIIQEDHGTTHTTNQPN